MPLPPPLPLRSRVLPTLLAALVALPGLSAANAPAKDYSIFVGLDVAVARNGKYFRVAGAEKNAVQIIVNRESRNVPLKEARDLRIDRGVKLSYLRATVSNISGTKGESRIQASYEMETMANAMTLQDMVEDKRENILGAARMASIFQRDGGDAFSKALAQMPELDNSITRAARGGNELLTGKSAAEGGLDDTGFVVSFAASAPAALEKCHVAVVADYTLGGNGDITLSNVTLQPLGTLGPDPREFTCQVRGFPKGAQLRGYHLAIYSRGQEVATNLSSRRTDITRDEAVLFLTLEHMAKHPGETRPPVPVLMIPRTDFVSRLGPAPLDQVIYAQVAKNGKILHLSADAHGVAQLPAALTAAVEQVAFVPALEKGMPVEGVARLRLVDLVGTN